MAMRACAQGHTEIAQDGGVGKIALEAAYGELIGEMVEDGISDAEVAFGVLVVNGVDLVGHGAGADLADLNLLLEVLHHDIHPEVAAEVEHDDIDAADIVEDGGEIVIVGNLGGVWLTAETEFLGDELIAELDPIDGG